jgi:8-oxo-dGTP pyrophosphatase MutT (NUDIX family)
MTAPIAVRPASTVILVREQGGAPAVYITQRSLKSGFMGGNYVFPGGKVDAGDEDTAFWARKGDISRAAVARRLHDPSEKLALLAFAVAAIRETWEEAGVLLADLESGGAGLLLTSLLASRDERAPDGDWLRSHLVVKGGLLTYSALWPWSHWITPTAMKARFDTRFFIAFMPDGQTCHPDSYETVEGRWMTPRHALEANEQGRVNLSPPTLVTLHNLLAYETFSALKAALPRPGWGPVLMPKMLVPKVGPMIIQTWDPDYADPEKTLPAVEADLQRLPVGAPFSRLWNDKGTWRPVA